MLKIQSNYERVISKLICKTSVRSQKIITRIESRIMDTFSKSDAQQTVSAQKLQGKHFFSALFNIHKK